MPDPNSKIKATLCQRLRALDDSDVAFVVEKIPVPCMILKNLQNSSEPAFNEDTCLAEFLSLHARLPELRDPSTVVKCRYGSDVSGSRFASRGGLRATCGWNLGHDRNGLEDSNIDGLARPFLYFATAGSLFPMHTEDKDLLSLNLQHSGPPKVWFAAGQNQKSLVEEVLRANSSNYRDNLCKCKECVRHKEDWLHPEVMAASGVNVKIAFQYPGEFILTLRGGYHEGFNTGTCVNEALNLCSPRARVVLPKVGSCQCPAGKKAVSDLNLTQGRSVSDNLLGKQTKKQKVNHGWANAPTRKGLSRAGSHQIRISTHYGVDERVW